MNPCYTCGNTYLVPVAGMGMQPLAEHDNGKRYPLDLVRCSECKLIQLSAIPPQREVFRENHPYTTGNSKERQRHFRELAKTITDMVPRGLVVDIGCNDGTLLKAVHEISPRFRLLGVEPTNQVRRLTDEGFPGKQEFFTAKLAADIVAEHGKASVVTASNVLAHVPDPHDFLDGISHLLSAEGIFVTENHDWNSISRGLQIDTIYHEHLRYYTVASLTHQLAMHDLTVTGIEHIPAHGGSFRVTAMRERNDLQPRMWMWRKKMRALMESLRGPVYGIGATTRATPLINFADLGRWLACVCEVPWSDKIGQYIPGTLIPVVDEKKLIEDQPPFALVLSWHIADDILPKIRSMGYKGQFVIPLPEPEVH